MRQQFKLYIVGTGKDKRFKGLQVFPIYVSRSPSGEGAVHVHPQSRERVGAHLLYEEPYDSFREGGRWGASLISRTFEGACTKYRDQAHKDLSRLRSEIQCISDKLVALRLLEGHIPSDSDLDAQVAYNEKVTAGEENSEK